MFALLGDSLWPGQETFIREIVGHPHVFALKARKLGLTTIACAFDAYVLRFRDQNARVHLFSHVEKAALELLEQVRFGLDRLGFSASAREPHCARVRSKRPCPALRPHRPRRVSTGC